jgi:photosynthetic reaction center cytochrome c subunit
MRLGSRRTFLGAGAMTVVWLLGARLAGGQAAPQPKPQMAEEVFKNVQVLKGIPVNEFMGTMGVFSAALGMSCEDCHAASDRDWTQYAIDNPRKRTARRMVLMMAEINRANFGRRQVVTCNTCHRASDRPTVTPDLSTLYTAKLAENPDILTQAAGAPPADQVLDKYVQALGGAQRLGSLTSFVAKGTSSGYGPEGEKRPVEIFVKAPAQRTAIIHTLDGDNTTAYDGRGGWIAAPHRPVPVLPLTGQELDAARLDAELAIPARIKEALTKWRVGPPSTINDRDVQVVQGTSTAGVTATLYFDKESGLLVRQVRYVDSPVGRMPTHVDYADYRDVSGVKLPFRLNVVWLDGQESIQLTEIQPNVPIDAAKFGKPAPPPQ